MMDSKVYFIFCLLHLAHSTQYFPHIKPTLVSQFSLEDDSDSPLFRSLLVDPSGEYAFVGAKSSVYKLKLGSAIVETAKETLPITNQLKPDFKDRSTDRKWWTSVSHTDPEFQNYEPIKEFLDEYNQSPNSDTYKSLNLKNRLTDYLRDLPYGSIYNLEGNAFLELAQQYSSIYQSANLTFRQHCERQAELLSLYYGHGLQMNLSNTDSLCQSHIRGLTLMDNNRLFTIQTGIFGTLPVSATGTNKYSNWLHFQGEIQPLLTCLFDGAQQQCNPSQPIYPPYSIANYSGVLTDPASHSDISRLPQRNTYLMTSPENYLGKLRHCDNTPAPSRLILSADNLAIINSGVLIGDNDKESCSDGALVQLLLGGYHPDQKTFSLFSSSGNGASADMQAVYIITEIGQEKQQDLMLHYLNLPEIYPLTSSTSLAMVRLLVDKASGDIDPASIVISNPFKYTWVTSPLNRFGRLDKTGSQEQVAYTPKPIGLHEDNDYIYFFFREADWENTPIPSYNIRRYHHQINSYSHALYFPWEKLFIDRDYIKHEEAPGETFEELYAPDYKGWQHINDNLRVTGRVARISKKDAGLPLALTDANLFDLDHKLSLTTFQTFVKSRLTCRVPVAESTISEWAGHGQPFGRVGKSARQVETSEATIKPTTFINRYLYKKHPVVLQGVLSTSPAIKTWETNYFCNAPPSAMSSISVYDSSMQQLTKVKMSMREFAKSQNSDLFVFDDIPSFLLKDLAFPNIFKCDPFIKSLRRHFLTYYKRKLVTEPVVTPDDRLICSVIGQPSYVLVPFESWQALASNESSIDYSKVNYETHPWLRELKYFNALQVRAGDCVYVPNGWYAQSSYSDIPTISVVYSWTPQLDKVSKAKCGKHDLRTDYELGVYSRYFSAATVQRDDKTDSLIHYFVFYLGDRLVSTFTQKQFIRKLKRDDKLFGKLANWTEEVEEISSELFQILDVNGNDKFSLDDVVNMDAEARDVLVAQVQDRLQDLGAIMDEQQKVVIKQKVAQQKPAVDRAAAAATSSNKKKVQPADDMGQMFKEELQREMEKMFQEEEVKMKDAEKAEKSSRQAGADKAKKKSGEKASKKEKATKKATNSDSSAKGKDKYTVVSDDEVEILAEDDTAASRTDTNKASAKAGIKSKTKNETATTDKDSKSKASNNDKTVETKASSATKPKEEL